ncbi:MAG: DUF3565 domain-containing protein [Psychrobium sp.]
MKQPMVGFHKDDENHWVAKLACGHNQHVRHDPPWQNRPWVQNKHTRDAMLGIELTCVKCDENAPRDWHSLSDFLENSDKE